MLKDPLYCPLMIYFPDPKVFLEANYKELCWIAHYRCDCWNTLEHEEDIRQEFFTKYLNRKVSFDSTRSSLGMFIFVLMDYTVKGYMRRLKEWNKDKRGTESFGLFDVAADTEARVEAKVFGKVLKNLNLKRTNRKTVNRRSVCQSSNIYLDAFRMRCAGLTNREVARKLKVSDMHISKVVSVVQALYKSMCGEQVAFENFDTEEMFNRVRPKWAGWRI